MLLLQDLQFIASRLCRVEKSTGSSFTDSRAQHASCQAGVGMHVATWLDTQ